MLRKWWAKLNQAWRMLATGFCFMAFACCCLLLWIIAFPILNLRIKNPKQRQLLARKLIRYSCRFLIGIMTGVGVLDYELVGFDKLNKQGMFIIANHPSLIDTLFFLAYVENVVCIVKGELLRNFFLAAPIKAANYISNEHGIATVDACIAALQAGDNVIMFPEGTRTPKDGNIVFKRGAANIAIRSIQNITPVAITCQPLTLSKGDLWWQVPETKAIFQLIVKNEIEARKWIQDDIEITQQVSHLNTYLEALFKNESQCHVRTRN